jgi:hypothetical protein
VDDGPFCGLIEGEGDCGGEGEGAHISAGNAAGQ